MCTQAGFLEAEEADNKGNYAGHPDVSKDNELPYDMKMEGTNNG